jgi:NAD(P)-dependent dehydrogenase (short-subunit alcohol dehydrogenase family)
MPRVLITGVSTGIGKALAEKFAAEGWDVIGTLRDVSRAPSFARGGDRIAVENLDLAVAGDARRLAERVVEKYGCPDILVNNAGVLQFGPVEFVSAEETERLYRVNVFETIDLARALVPCMRDRGSGTIVNVTSLGGRMVFPFFAVYNSSKHALEGFSEGLWHELQPFGIKVKTVEPGFVETAIWGKVLGEQAEKPEPYTQYMEAMEGFEASITDRTPPADAADEIYVAALDRSDRLRYPVAAYAKPILRARRWLGELRVMRFFHGRWMGKD